MNVRNPFKRQRPAAWELPGQPHSARDLILVPVLVVLGMLLYPVGASAAAGLSRVLITDPTNTSQQAHVDASGNLQVGGTVNVSNSPTVNAQQSGNWNMGITGTPTVSIDPSANTVNNVSDPERQAIEEVLGGVHLSPGNLLGSTNPFYTVPANTRLVITHVSAEVDVPTGESPTFMFLQRNSSQAQFLDLVLVGSDSDNHYASNDPTTLVMDAGDTIGVLLARNSALGDAGADVIISGYLLNCTTNLPCN